MSDQPASIPPLIERYQAAHDRHDIDGALATFTSDAVVLDEDETWAGTDRIRQWLTKTSTEYTYTRTLLGAEHTGTASWLVRNRLEGDFPGNVVDLRYEFTLHGDHISGLTIAP
jgi:ketosteroid isomerase-like protein